MNKQKGFTFIEILVTVAVVGLIILVSSSLNKDVIVFSRIFQSGLNAADEARKILRQWQMRFVPHPRLLQVLIL